GSIPERKSGAESDAMYFEPRDPASNMPMITVDLASKESLVTQNKDAVHGEDKGIVFTAETPVNDASGSPGQRMHRFLSDPGPDNEPDDHLQS
ncbi:hypothetical protein KFY57_28425, partial [Salmonella enterica subsp. enterica serovar Typhimurium]|nr:hypothetical protein [Salmonella enterica subsp. enterica serovar Typhimurium]